MKKAAQNLRRFAALHNLPMMSRIGWILYAASMLTPGYHFRGFGAQMWLLVPRTGIQMLNAGSFMGLLVGVTLLIAVGSNVTVFIPLPRWLTVSAIFAPWLAFAVPLAAHRIDLGRVFSIPCFFPWAIGIAMINLAQLRGPVRRSP